ncbi:MAG TPA: hypothetical protein VHE35_06980 [Kofleriaceae bacterium]|nr:hypothetical protein [Kofleriaceae bacterium]
MSHRPLARPLFRAGPLFVARSLFVACPLLLAAACTDAAGPSTDPPPPWGVPITGGTLLVTRDGSHAIVADPDRNRILSVELTGDRVAAEVALTPGDEPGRVVEDGAGRIHVALRHGGAVVTLDAATGHVDERAAVCAEPRGLAWDPTGDVLHVACADGELVTLPAAGGAPVRRLQLDHDLRDVVVRGDQLVVTRFRTAEVLTLDASGAVISRFAPPPIQRFGVGGRSPEIPVSPAIAAVAWRAIGLPDGRVLITHQRQLQGQLGTTDDGYDGGCGGRAEAALATARAGELPVPIRTTAIGTLPVDVAFSPVGDRFAVVLAGDQTIHVMPTSALDEEDQGDGCTFPPKTDDAQPGGVFSDDLGAPTSIAYTPANDLVVFYPELPGLVVRAHTGDTRVIRLPGDIGYDAGRALFHRQTAAKLACASCHPEGGDDGLVWDFVDLGKRRTQNLSGHISGRAPYHWSGDLDDLPALMTEVFTGRMAGGALTATELASLGPWLDRVPAPAPAPGDAAAIARGKALFDSSEVGCSSCHGGALFTNDARFAVGTGAAGEAFKVPSLLGVASRPPYLHDGCAKTLADRFGPCGGGDLHGHTSQLSAAQTDDLVAYLSSL